MPFQKPRILTDEESNYLRGKCMAGHASNEEQMRLIGHFDLVEMKLRGALETLRTCMPDRVYVYDDKFDGNATKWSDSEPDHLDHYETVDFEDILGE